MARNYIHPAYNAISDFFFFNALPEAVSYMTSFVKAAQKPGHIFKTGTASDLVLFTHQLELLIEGIYNLPSDPELQLNATIEDNDPDTWWLTNYLLYCRWNINNGAWDYFPRNLSKKEFLQPAKIFHKFKKYKSLAEWKKIINNLLYDALSDSEYKDTFSNNDLLSIYILLLKLIEAAHLQNIRAIRKADNALNVQMHDCELQKRTIQYKNTVATQTAVQDFLLLYRKVFAKEDFWQLLNNASSTHTENYTDYRKLFDQLKLLLDALELQYPQVK